jgi:predicted transposase/invertase (TIGR01784 family)
MKFTKSERESYEEHLKWLQIETSALGKVEDTAFELGYLKGKAEKNIEIAKSLLSNGIDIQIVSSSTGLSIEELKKMH